MFTENTDVFFSDLGIDVTFGAGTFKAIFDKPDQSVGTFGISAEYMLTVKTSAISSLVGGSTVSIASANYSVREIRKIDDGAFSLVSLAKA